MKNNRLLSAALGIALAMGSASSQAILLRIDPAMPTVAVGDLAVLDVVIAGLGAGGAPSLGTYDLNVTFDPSILSFSTATFGTGLNVSGLDSIQSVTPGVGTINLSELSLDSVDDLNALQADTFTLVILGFQALAIGRSSALGITINALGDAIGDSLPVDEVVGGKVNVAESVNPVPEPASIVLLALGLVGLLLKRRAVG